MRRVLLAILALLLLAPAVGADMAITYQIITPDGTTLDLTSTTITNGYVVRDVSGWDMPPVEHISRAVPQHDGGVLDEVRVRPRRIVITEEIYGSSRSNMHTHIATVIDKLRPDRTSTLQPLKLRYTNGATSADLYCYYEGAVTQDSTPFSRVIGFSLIAYDPYWYATTATTVSGPCAASLAVTYIAGLVDDAWTAMGNSGTGEVLDIAIDDNDDVYIAHAATNWDGIAAADYIAKWTKSTTTWSALGTGASAQVNCLAIDPEGNLYAGGSFGSMGGVANTGNIAMWDGSTWNAVGTGGGGVGAQIIDMAFDSQGNLYVVGNFSTMGGDGDCNYVAKWDGSAWSPLDTGLDGIAWGVAVDASDDVYITGQFTDVNGGGGGTYNYIIKWNGSSFSALGTGLNDNGRKLVVASDGTLYVGGEFTTADGVTVNYIAAWNGSTFEALDSGTNNDVYGVAISPDDELWIGGTFTTVGSDSVSMRLARWNGTAWVPSDFIPPSSGSLYTQAWDSAGNRYISFSTAGEAIVPNLVTATNSGSRATYPTIAISGPGRLVSITNETTGAEIPANLYINDGEPVTIDLGDPGEIPGSKTLTTDWDARPNQGGLIGKLLGPADLSTFTLEASPIASSGVNKIGIFLTGTPVESGDGGDLLSRWAGITGITTTNTDDGRLYVSVTADDADTTVQARLYKDSAKANLVATANLAASVASRTVTEANSSGLGGSVYQETAITYGANNVSNNGFETAGAGGADIWDTWAETAGDGALANETTIVHAGSDAAKLTAGASTNTYVRQSVAGLSASTMYRLSFYTRTDGSSLAVRFGVYDTDNSDWIIPIQAATTTGTSYTFESYFFTTPVGCTNIRVDFQCPDNDGDIAYLDNVSVLEVTNAPDTDITVDYALAIISHYNRYWTVSDAVT